MILVYIIVSVAAVSYGIYIIHYLVMGSPSVRREKAAYRELMDYYTQEASHYLGRQVTEQEILHGNVYNITPSRSSRRRKNKHH